MSVCACAFVWFGNYDTYESFQNIALTFFISTEKQQRRRRAMAFQSFPVNRFLVGCFFFGALSRNDDAPKIPSVIDFLHAKQLCFVRTCVCQLSRVFSSFQNIYVKNTHNFQTKNARSPRPHNVDTMEAFTRLDGWCHLIDLSRDWRVCVVQF